jgi:LacI family repressor for deo operon, udp, cdd, tsx, nupC, and nupG
MSDWASKIAGRVGRMDRVTASGRSDGELTKPARIKDVAAQAGVSFKTVTNVVHGRPNVGPETRARVQAVIAELGYRPSLAGRRLQSGRSNMVTLAVPRIDEPFLGALAHAMIAAAKPLGLTVLIDETGGDAEREALAASGYPGHGIDGVIFSPAAVDPRRFTVMSRATPMVMLGEFLPDSAADHVAIDDVASAGDVVAHLLGRGRRRIAFLGYQPVNPTGIAGLRYRGYRQQMAAAGFPVEDRWVIPGPGFSREEGETQVRQAIPHLGSVDALVCASDLLAIGAMRALRQHHIQVPDDVAVTGWDNTVDGAYHSPSLTSVAPALAELATLALTALIRRIKGDREPGTSYRVPHHLIVRESSGAPKQLGAEGQWQP